MTEKQFVDLVERMRETQKKFFKEKDKATKQMYLKLATRLEADVDDAIIRHAGAGFDPE